MEEEKSNLLHPANPGGFPTKAAAKPKEYPIVITDRDLRKRWLLGFIGVVIFIALVVVLGVDVEPSYEVRGPRRRGHTAQRSDDRRAGLDRLARRRRRRELQLLVRRHVGADRVPDGVQRDPMMAPAGRHLNLF